MLLIVAIIAFLIVFAGVFTLASLLDQRRSRARLLRERLATVQQAAERKPTEELALLRDELLSEIPALDRILQRSPRVTRLRLLLQQADMKVRAGNFLLLCVVSACLFVMLLFVYASFRRQKRFQKFEELFPEAIDTLARAVRAGHAFTTALELIASE